SSLVSGALPVSDDMLYLQAAWVRADKGAGYIGRQWFPSQVYDYAIGGYTLEEWLHSAQMVWPPEQSQEAAVWLLNVTNGKVAFADSVFVRVGQRNAAPCDASGSAGRAVCGP